MNEWNKIRNAKEIERKLTIGRLEIKGLNDWMIEIKEWKKKECVRVSVLRDRMVKWNQYIKVIKWFNSI